MWTRDYHPWRKKIAHREARRLSTVVQSQYRPLLIIAGGREHCQEVYQEGDPSTVAKKKSCLLSPTTRLSAATTTRRRRRVACCHYNTDCLLPLQLKNILLSKILLLLLTKSQPRRNLYQEEEFAQTRETKSRSLPRVADYLLSISTLSRRGTPTNLILLATSLRTVAKTLARVQDRRRSNKPQRKKTTTEDTILKPKTSHSTPS